MNVTNIIKILSTVSTIILGVAEIIRQLNLYNSGVKDIAKIEEAK